MRITIPCLLAAASIAAWNGSSHADQITVRFHPPGDPKGAFEVAGVAPDRLEAHSARLGELFRVGTVTGEGPGSIGEPLFGTYSASQGVLTFRPRYPLEPGVKYAAIYREPGAKSPSATLIVALPRPPAPSPSTVVTRVSPGSDLLPENLLKFYVEFSAPMSRGEAYEHLQLLDAKNKPLELPFLELGEELWDPGRTRFTILFDPGRIKQGLKPREELGPVLESGKTYTLVIDKNWRDANDVPLKSGFRKRFRAGPPDTVPPDPSRWLLEAPRGGTKGALVARFPEPLDRAILKSVLGVADSAGRPVAGTAAVAVGEQAWSFTPSSPWNAGSYSLVVGRSLEDLAGNSVGRPFEIDVFDKIDQRSEAGSVKLPFEVGGPAR